ncbi:MAG: GGDEF domain-containing protein [Acidisphaera sp.]|nr:GGDEF domain-containing protein [Acidisphaera sp.]
MRIIGAWAWLFGARRSAGQLGRFAGSGEGLLVHRHGIVIDLNQAAGEMLGRSTRELRGRHMLELVAPDFTALVQMRLNRPENLASPDGERMEIELLASGDRHVPTDMVSRSIELDGQPAVVVTLRDLTERRAEAARLRHAAYHDPLTELPNRTLFDRLLVRSLEHAAATDGQVAVYRLDLDRFAAVERLGDHAGDKLLAELASRLRGHVRAIDTAARLGGDAFAVIQPLTDGLKQAADVAMRIVKGLSEPTEIYGQRVAACVNAGVAVFPADAASPGALVTSAETALYRAKQDGRGCVCFYDAAMDRFRRQHRELEQDLLEAVNADELELHFQPMFDCRSGDLHGFEALLRWIHPVRGEIPPDELIAAAEPAGLIRRIGAWALEAACAEAACWPSPWRVAVNLPSPQFRFPELPELIDETLSRTGLAPDRLELEVKEGMLTDDPASALDVLEALHRRSVHVSLQDFGTGTSSLNALSRFPVDKIKIDRSFIEGIGEGAQAPAIVDAMVRLGHGLNLCVAVEGVETPAQLDFVRRQQCDQVQGSLLGPPMPRAALPEMFVRRLEQAPKPRGKPVLRLVSTS